MFHNYCSKVFYYSTPALNKRDMKNMNDWRTDLGSVCIEFLHYQSVK